MRRLNGVDVIYMFLSQLQNANNNSNEWTKIKRNTKNDFGLCMARTAVRQTNVYVPMGYFLRLLYRLHCHVLGIWENVYI